MASTRIFLIRHADVENPHKVLYGFLDGFQLSARGRAQAAELGRRLAGAGLKRIVHSPLSRALETAEIINANLGTAAHMSADPELREADFSKYLQGVPYWQIPLRRPLWFVHKARRGQLPQDESYETLGGRVLAVMRSVATEHPGEPAALVSHADPLQAAWILLDGRPHTEREMHRKTIDKAGMLQVDLQGDTPISWTYVPPPKIEAAAGAVA